MSSLRWIGYEHLCVPYLLATFCAAFHIECISRYIEGSMSFPLLSWDAEESVVKRHSNIQNKREPEDDKSLSWLFDSM